jgi:hypothetical protein
MLPRNKIAPRARRRNSMEMRRLSVGVGSMLVALTLCAGALAEETAAQVAATDDPVICKRIAVTGSRVKKVETCRTKSQWAEVERKAKDYMRGIDRSTGNQPGGDTLPQGG